MNVAEFVVRAPCLLDVMYKHAHGVLSDNQVLHLILDLFHQRIKQLTIKCQFVNENAEYGNAVLKFLRSRNNWEDMFTKLVGANIFLSGSFAEGYGWTSAESLASGEVGGESKDTLPCPIPTVLRVCFVNARNFEEECEFLFSALSFWCSFIFQPFQSVQVLYILFLFICM
jgi:hypothetical protein